MLIQEIHPKSILSASKIYPYVINPYVGCQHNCSYCYAKFMKRFTGHKEPWGQFVDVKVTAPELLAKEVLHKKKDRVWVSGVCDPYQPLEGKYRLTRGCLEILAEQGWPVTIQTRSALILRDLDILKRGPHFEAGFSITTADDSIRKIFEPTAPPIQQRLRALEELHKAGIRTFVMIAPMLPGAEGLADLLAGKVDRVRLDRMNYHYADWVYRQHGLEQYLTDEYFSGVEAELRSAFARLGIEVAV
jgi:DNA repair photolyase